MILYSNGCPLCELLKRQFKLRNLEVVICEDLDEMRRLEIDKLPMLELDEGPRLNFADSLKWLNGGTVNV